MGKFQLGWLLAIPGGVGQTKFRQEERSLGRLEGDWVVPNGLLT